MERRHRHRCRAIFPHPKSVVAKRAFPIPRRATFAPVLVPELRDVPAARLHRPPSPGMPFAQRYPLPMVDHRSERETALEMFRR